ncbi:hypothetical protein TrLO_g6390 [Triparma laevis f. longispina]|uniref:protein xylosyltransferase n=1 Tax=Triparma laevis f. longispina TaxID=1714387 RepID=A0A9W7DTZ6_9STRA|nr:hypothetical protein TrLO_g6390 [Triparma laevis f. longispina]
MQAARSFAPRALLFLLLTVLSLPSVHSYPSSNNDFECPPCDLRTTPINFAYLITVHDDRTLTDAFPLLNAVSSSSNIVLIHVDGKYPEEYYKQSEVFKVVEKCQCGTRVIHSGKMCEWGTWSMNEPVIWAMDVLAHDPRFTGKYDKFITLSGDSLPTLTNSAMADLFSEHLMPYNILTSFWSETGFTPTKYNEYPKHWHKRNAYRHPVGVAYKEYETGRKVMKRADVYFGSQWMVLNPDLVDYFAKSLRDRDSFASTLKRAYIEQKRVVTDETFFPTLVMNEDRFRDTVPTAGKGEGICEGVEWLKSVRYERMDEHAPSPAGQLPDKQRIMAIEGVEPRVWGPYFLGIYDLLDIKRSGALFIRKVSLAVEPNLYNVFPMKSREEIEGLPDISWHKEIDFVIADRPKF